MRFRTDVRGQDDQRVAEIDGAALAVREIPMIQHLEQDVGHIPIRSLDLIKQRNLITLP
jgi:hypothetical protein